MSERKSVSGLTIFILGVPKRLASSRGHVDRHPETLRERRPPEDPRQVADQRGVQIRDQRDRFGASAPQKLLGPVPHLRGCMLCCARHSLLYHAAPVHPPHAS